MIQIAKTDDVTRYVVTTAQCNIGPNKKYLSSLEKICSEQNADLLILPVRGVDNKERDLDPVFDNYTVIQGDKKLNNKIRIKDFDLRPNQIQPLTGLGRFAQSDVSAIVAAPKIAQKVIPNSNTNLPKVLMSTGAVTMPNYKRTHRINKVAREDHTYGAVMVEIVNGTKYHFRHLNALTNGQFVDLGMKYNGNKTPVHVRPPAMILGDWHSGDTNKQVRAETFRMLEEYNPKIVVLHDLFNGHTINHHNQGKILTQYLDAQNRKGKFLPEELTEAASELEEMVTHLSPDAEIVVVKSNHDQWLYDYLDKQEYTKESHPFNHSEALRISQEIIRGRDALEAGLEIYMQNMDRVRFLDINEDYKILGWQIGNHGHKGAHGARGSLRSIENANGKSITGHSHVPGIYRDTWSVGTSTDLQLDYNTGYSGWMNTHALLYDVGRQGKPQLVNIINGKHRA